MTRKEKTKPCDHNAMKISKELEDAMTVSSEFLVYLLNSVGKLSYLKERALVVATSIMMPLDIDLKISLVKVACQQDAKTLSLLSTIRAILEENDKSIGAKAIYSNDKLSVEHL